MEITQTGLNMLKLCLFSEKKIGSKFSEAANGGVLQIICSSAARKLNLDMLPGS